MINSLHIRKRSNLVQGIGPLSIVDHRPCHHPAAKFELPPGGLGRLTSSMELMDCGIEKRVEDLPSFSLSLTYSSVLSDLFLLETG